VNVPQLEWNFLGRVCKLRMEQKRRWENNNKMEYKSMDCEMRNESELTVQF
jgi:hypothetical protein